MEISEFHEAPRSDSYQLWECLAIHAYRISKGTGIPLENFLLGTLLYFSCMCNKCDSSLQAKDVHLSLHAKCNVLPTKDGRPKTIYFHRVSPMTSSDSGNLKEIPSPWGYFSHQAEPRRSGESIQDEEGLQSEV